MADLFGDDRAGSTPSTRCSPKDRVGERTDVSAAEDEQQPRGARRHIDEELVGYETSSSFCMAIYTRTVPAGTSSPVVIILIVIILVVFISIA